MVNIKDLIKVNYMLVNKRFNEIILEMVYHYDNEYNNLVPDWENNISKLIEKLVINDDYDGILFLMNNYKKYSKINAKLNYYAAMYNKLDIIKYLHLNDYCQLLFGSARGGNLKLFNIMIKLCPKNYMKIVINAAKGGQLDLVKEYVKYYNNYGVIAYSGAKGGHMNVIEYALANGPVNYQEIADGAAKHGYLDIVKFAVSKGANNFNSIAIVAAIYGHIEILKYALENGANDIKKILLSSIEHGRLNCVKYIIKKKLYEDLKKAALTAAKYGKLNIVKYIVKKGYKDFNNIAFIGAVYKFLDIVEYAVDNGAVVSDELLNFCRSDEIRRYLIKKNKKLANDLAIIAARENKLDLMKYAIENGADHYQFYSITASKSGNIPILKYLIDNGYKLNYMEIMKDASYYDQLNVLKFMFEIVENRYKLFDWTEISYGASINGHINIIRFLIESKLPLNLDEILFEASHAGKFEIVKYLNTLGVYDYNQMAEDAIHNVNFHAFVYALEKGANNFDELLRESNNIKDRGFLLYLRQKMQNFSFI